MEIFLIIAAIAIVVIIVLMYNRLITLKNRVEQGWAQIDVQLQRRYDLIPNLVETVKGYATHESGVFQKVTEARSNAINAQGPAQQAEAENMISGALKSLFAVSEAYPDLKANENFLALQEELTGTEGKIAYARQFYNETVQTFNTAIQVFPTNLLAKVMNFTDREYFEMDGGPETRGPVKVQF